MNTSHASVMPDVTRRTLSQTIPSEETLLLLLAVEDTNKQISLPTLSYFLLFQLTLNFLCILESSEHTQCTLGRFWMSEGIISF